MWVGQKRERKAAKERTSWKRKVWKTATERRGTEKEAGNFGVWHFYSFYTIHCKMYSEL